MPSDESRLTPLRRLLLQAASSAGPFARNVGWLLSGTAAGQLLLFIAAPLLTRLYSPADFGALAVFTSLASVPTVVAAFRYELVIPLPEDDVDAASAVLLSLTFVAATAIATLLLSVLFGAAAARSLGVPELSRFSWLAALSVAASGTFMVVNYWALRTKQFSDIASTRLRQAVVTLAVQFGAWKLGGAALVLGFIAGQCAGCVTLARAAFASPAFRRVGLATMRNVAQRYRQFPLFSTWEAMANTAGTQLPPVVLSLVFGSGPAGLYSVAHRVLALPVSLVGGAVGQVFFSEVAEAKRLGRHGELVARLHHQLSLAGLAPCVLLMIVGPELFSRVFGRDWREAGEFARWMAPWIYLLFVTSPLSTVLAALERQRAALKFQASMLLVRSAGIAAGATLGGLRGAVGSFALVSAACYIAYLILIFRATETSLWQLWNSARAAIAVAAICTLPSALITFVAPPSLVTLSGSIVAGVMMIGAHYWRTFIVAKKEQA